MRHSKLILLFSACFALTPLIEARRVQAAEPSRDEILKDLKDTQEAKRLLAIKAALSAGEPDAATIAAFAEALKDVSSDVRRAAAAGLEKFGAPARAAVPALILAADDKEHAVRAVVLSALGALAPPSKAALPVLIAALKDPSPQLRIAAIEALRRHGAAANDALPALIELTASETHPDVVYALAASLAENNPIPPELAPFYASALKGSGTLRTKAVEALGKIGAKALPAILPLLKSEQATARREAAAFVEKFAAEAKCAVPQLVAALEDSDAYVRKSAATALVAAGHDALGALPDLIKLIENTDPLVRSHAMAVIESIGADAHDAIPALVLQASDKNLACRTAAGKALAKMSASGIAALLELLKSSRDEVRTSAAMALTLCGDAAMPGLAAVLNSENADAGAAALLALDRIPGGAREPAISALISLMKIKTSPTRNGASNALNKCGAHAVKPLIEALHKCPEAPAEARSLLTDALGRAGAAPAPSLIEIIKTQRDGPMLLSAIEALGKIGAPASDATPLLVGLLTTQPPPAPPAPVPVVKRNVATNPPAPPPAPVVPPYVKIDTAVLQALSGFGRNASAALPMLFELLKDGDGNVRGEAARAISKIAAGTERIPALSEFVERCDSGSLATALRAFQDAGMDALLTEFESESPATRQRIASVFNNMTPGPACAFLAASLKNADPRLRTGPALALSEIRRVQRKAQPPAAKGVNLDALLAALKDAVMDSDAEVRVLAAYSVQKAIYPYDG